MTTLTNKKSKLFPAAPLHFFRPTKQVLSINLANGNRLTLVSTAHVSKKSVELVKEIITNYKPNAIAVELDSRRLKAITQQSFKDLDVVKIIKEKQGYFFLAFLLLSIYQKKMAERTGSEPGAEMKKAVKLSKETGVPLLLIDRPIDITLKRIFSAVGFFKRFSFLVSLIGFEADDLEKVTKPKSTESKADSKKSLAKKKTANVVTAKTDKKSKPKNDVEQELAAVLEEDALVEIRKQMRENIPEVATVLLDERDRYMTLELQNYFSQKKITM